MMRIKKNDTVLVLTGKDKGKKGAVLDIKRDKNLVRVKGVAVVTKHIKPRRQGEQGGIKKIEGYIHISNVMPVDAEEKPCRVNFKVIDGKKVRVSNRTKEII